MKRAALLLLPFLLLVSCTAGKADPPVAPPIRITILGVNDFHGAIEERKTLLKTTGGGTVEVRTGGAALLAAYVHRLRKQNPEGTLLLSGGDMWQGSLESNWFEGRPVVLLDNALGFDAAALGNHEFDYGPVGPDSLADVRAPAETRYGALLARQGEAKFPILAANVRSEGGAPSFQPWVMVQKRGVKIAVVGLSTEDTPNTTQRPNVIGLSFDPPGPALAKAAKEARAAGAELVVVAAHVGGFCKRGTDPEDKTACRPDTEVMETLRAVEPGLVDAFVAGHTHAYMAHVVEGVPVIEQGSYGQAVGRIDIDVDPKTRKKLAFKVHAPTGVCRDVLADIGTCFPVEGSLPKGPVVPATLLGSPIEPDPEIERMLAPFRQEVAEIKAQVLATAERPIGVARFEPSEMGVLVTDEMRAATKRLPDVPDADFALQNAGGIRTTLAKGPITYGALYEVLPFDNMLATMEVTGAQVEALLTAVARTGRVMQTSGLRAEYCGEGATARVKVFDLATGKPISATKKYVVVWNDFLANGGDGTKDALAGVTVSIHGRHLLRDVVAEGLKTRKTVNAESAPLLDPKKPRMSRCKN